MQRHSPCQRLLSLTLTLCLLLSGMTFPVVAYPDQTFAYDAAGNRSSVVAPPQTAPATTPPEPSPPPAGGTAASGGAGTAAAGAEASEEDAGAEASEEDAGADPPAAPAPTTPPAPTPAPTPAAPAATTTACTANHLDQYTRVGTATHTYGKNGNRTSDGTITYRWDTENRLTGATTTAYDVHTDHLDTPRLLTSSTGAVVWSSHHEPFGKAHIQTDPDGDGTHLAFPLRFPGQYEDAETGLHYNRHRYYDPEIGRYLSPDPLGQADGTHLYQYAQGDPLSTIDPLGLISGKTLVNVGDFFTAVADEASFGLGPLAREYLEEKFGLGGHVNPCSSAYTAGGWASAAVNGARTVATGITRLAAKGIASLARGAGRGVDDVVAHAPVGRRGAPLHNAPYHPVRNAPTRINGRDFTGHALDQMQNRGLIPSVVENTIRTDKSSPGRLPGRTRYYDPVNKVTVITDTASGRVLTTYPGGG